VGKAIAVVLADSRALAEGAAARVTVDYEPVRAVAEAQTRRRARHLDAPSDLAEMRIGYSPLYGIIKLTIAAIFGTIQLDFARHK